MPLKKTIKKLFSKELLLVLNMSTVLLLVTSCDTWNDFTSFLKGGKGEETPYDELTQTLPPSKATHVRESLAQGDLTTAVNRIVDPPTDGSDCAPERAPAQVSEEDLCPNSRFKNKNILYLGDSHSVIPSENAGEESQRFGHVFGKALKACEGASLHYQAYCGSRPRSYTSENGPRTSCGATAWGPAGFSYEVSNSSASNMSQLVEISQPKEVVINLGDNMFGWRENNGKREAFVPDPERLILEIDALVDQVPEGATCTWIGPTYHTEGSLYRKSLLAVDRYYAVLETAVKGRCRLIDSRPMFNRTRPNDGLHLVPSESRKWANEVLSQLGSDS